MYIAPGLLITVVSSQSVVVLDVKRHRSGLDLIGRRGKGSAILRGHGGKLEPEPAEVWVIVDSDKAPRRERGGDASTLVHCLGSAGHGGAVVLEPERAAGAPKKRLVGVAPDGKVQENRTLDTAVIYATVIPCARSVKGVKNFKTRVRGVWARGYGRVWGKGQGRGRSERVWEKR